MENSKQLSEHNVQVSGKFTDATISKFQFYFPHIVISRTL